RGELVSGVGVGGGYVALKLEGEVARGDDGAVERRARGEHRRRAQLLGDGEREMRGRGRSEGGGLRDGVVAAGYVVDVHRTGGDVGRGRVVLRVGHAGAGALLTGVAGRARRV